MIIGGGYMSFDDFIMQYENPRQKHALKDKNKGNLIAGKVH